MLWFASSIEKEKTRPNSLVQLVNIYEKLFVKFSKFSPLVWQNCASCDKENVIHFTGGEYGKPSMRISIVSFPNYPLDYHMIVTYKETSKHALTVRRGNQSILHKKDVFFYITKGTISSCRILATSDVISLSFVLLLFYSQPTGCVLLMEKICRKERVLTICYCNYRN